MTTQPPPHLKEGRGETRRGRKGEDGGRVGIRDGEREGRKEGLRKEEKKKEKKREWRIIIRRGGRKKKKDRWTGELREEE